MAINPIVNGSISAISKSVPASIGADVPSIRNGPDSSAADSETLIDSVSPASSNTGGRLSGGAS